MGDTTNPTSIVKEMVSVRFDFLSIYYLFTGKNLYFLLLVIGVHPSIIAVDVDETEDADNDTTSEETSSNNTTDFAEVDPGPSDMYDMSSLPEESSAANSMVDDVVRSTGHDNGRGQHENVCRTLFYSI